jgi:hypothetical protein
MKQIKCDHCGKLLDSEFDLVIWNLENGEITELSFRHGNRRGCDDRNFIYSRHIKDGYDVLLTDWANSSFNKGDTE